MHPLQKRSWDMGRLSGLPKTAQDSSTTARTEQKRYNIVQELLYFCFLFCLERAHLCFSPLTLHSLINFSHVYILIYSHSPVPIQNKAVKIIFLLWHFWLCHFPPWFSFWISSFPLYQVYLLPSFSRFFTGRSSIWMAAPSYPCQLWAIQPPSSLWSVYVSRVPKPFLFSPSDPTLKFLRCIWQAWRCWAKIVLRPGPTTEMTVDALVPSALPYVCISCFPLDHTSVS